MALWFLAEHADCAAELEWTTDLLFGVRPQVEAIRVHAGGAPMVSGGKPVVSVEGDRIGFGVSRFYRPATLAPTVPVWDWREREKQ